MILAKIKFKFRYIRFGHIFFSSLILVATTAPRYLMAKVPDDVDANVRYAMVIDSATGQILYSKNANERMFPSSMSKIMTLYVAYSLIQDGKIPLTKKYIVSEKAFRAEGSRMFLSLGSEVALEDLIKGIVIQSANDACIVLAEGLLGSEDAFVTKMNQIAQSLGMKDSHFQNTNGLPNEHHYTTARDMILLARAFIRDFPQYYSLNDQRTFKYNNILQYNRNTLLGYYGADGVKTGHTDIAGYGVTFSANHDNTRVIGVINGINSISKRTEVGKKLLYYIYNGLQKEKLYSAMQNIVESDLIYANASKIGLAPKDDVFVIEDKIGDSNIINKNNEPNSRYLRRVDIIFANKVSNKISKGEILGKMLVYGDYIDSDRIEIPLVAIQDAKKATFWERFMQNILMIF